MIWSPWVDARDTGHVWAPICEFGLINNAKRNRWYMGHLMRGGEWKQIVWPIWQCQWMAPLWDYGATFGTGGPSFQCAILWYSPICSIWELIPGSQILSVLFPETGIWPSLSGAWPTASCNSALLEHHCLALIAFCMVGLRHETEVNTQMYLKRWTRTTYTMADEMVY